MRALLVALSVLLVGPLGCATADSTEAKKAEPAAYVTGSNIARRADKPGEAPVQARSGDDIRRGSGGLPDFIGAPEGYRGAGN